MAPADGMARRVRSARSMAVPGFGHSPRFDRPRLVVMAGIKPIPGAADALRRGFPAPPDS